MFSQLLSPCFISIGIVKEIQLTSSFPLSLPENHHQNIRKFAEMVKWNGIREITIQSGEKGRGSDPNSLEGYVRHFIRSSFVVVLGD